MKMLDGYDDENWRRSGSCQDIFSLGALAISAINSIKDDDQSNQVIWINPFTVFFSKLHTTLVQSYLHLSILKT